METGQKTESRMKNNVIQRNEMEIQFDALSVNEAFARVAVAAFVAPLNPTMEEISDIKTAVSEAVTNAIIHGYDGQFAGESGLGGGQGRANQVFLHCLIDEDVLHVEIRDTGRGIENIEQAMEPLLRQSRRWTGPAWDSPLWKPLWMIWRLCPSRDAARWC